MRNERGERMQEIMERSPRSFLNTENASTKKNAMLAGSTLRAVFPSDAPSY